MHLAHTPTAPAKTARVARDDPSFPWYIGAALIIAVAGGFLLAVLLPLAAVLDWGWGVRWRALAQAHGHLQVIGWAGLFITGMGYRLLPRFAGRPLALPWSTRPALSLLIAGLLARAVAQPWLDQPPARALLVTGAAAELAGGALFAAAIMLTLAPVVRSFTLAPLFLLGATGIVAQAALGLLWLARLDGGYPALSSQRNATLLSLQFYAFLLPIVLGVSLRALPVFFKHAPPSAGQAWMVATLLAAGSGLHAGAPPLLSGVAAVRVEQSGALLIAAGIGLAIAHTGVWRRPERLRPSARHAALLIRTAYAWLAVGALWLTVDAVAALVDGRPVPAAHVDGLRHVFALGVVTTLITGMARLVLPWMAMRRQRGWAAAAETWTLWTLLTGATALRVAGAFLEARGAGSERYWVVAAGGLLGLTAVSVFGLAVLGAARTRTATITLHNGSEA